MARGLWIDIDEIGLKALMAEVGATQGQLEAALRSTYGRMGRWARSQAVRGLAPVLGIPQRILRARVLQFRMQYGVSSGSGAKVWFGMKPIKLSRLKPRQTAGGVRAMGGRFIPGAFIVQRHGRAVVFKREGQGRLPIVEQAADIDAQVQTWIDDKLVGSPEFEAQFFKTFEHELKWRTRQTS